MASNARDRTRQVRAAYDGPRTYATVNGDVSIEDLRAIDDGIRSRVEVRVANADGGDPDFVIVNPPTLVEDPTGSVVIHGRRFREDPMAAVAQVVARYGGASSKARDSRKGRR